MARLVVQFLIPVREDSEIARGELHPPFRWKALEDAIERAFGGWTTHAGQVRGVWVDPDTGTPVHDISRVYEVDVDEERIEETRLLLRRACRTFAQKCIRVVIRGYVEYLEPQSHDEPL